MNGLEEHYEKISQINNFVCNLNEVQSIRFLCKIVENVLPKEWLINNNKWVGWIGFSYQFNFKVDDNLMDWLID